MDYHLIGSHESIKKIRELIQLVSDTAFNVLLLGETGTGKEVVARLLHQSSLRKHKRFIKVNCAALPLTLLESELFGHEKGAFTGADKFKPGKFELASQGAIFLDEIGDMPMLLQAKLLQVLQSGEFNRLGGTSDVKVNTWVISSTNHDLEKDIKEGRFREDLYYRLNIIKIELPPLRNRKEDIEPLTAHFIERHRQDLRIQNRFSPEGDLRDLFQAYHWPGNVRELSSILLRLMVGIDPEVVKREILNNMKTDALSPSFMTVPGEAESPERAKSRDALQSKTPKTLKALKSEATNFIEKRAIQYALRRTGGNKTEAAKLLKISYKALFYKMNNLGIRGAN